MVHIGIPFSVFMAKLGCSSCIFLSFEPPHPELALKTNVRLPRFEVEMPATWEPRHFFLANHCLSALEDRLLNHRKELLSTHQLLQSTMVFVVQAPGATMGF